jgi:hypothetical protein
MNCKHLNLAFGAEKCPMVRHGTSLYSILETGFVISCSTIVYINV